MVNWCKNGRLLSHFGQKASVTDGSRTSRTWRPIALKPSHSSRCSNSEWLSADYFCRFILDPCSHHVSPVSISTSTCHVTASVGFWIVSMSVRMLPCGLHSVISRLLAGGALVSALCLCCFLAHRLLYGIFAGLFVRSCFFATPILR